MHHFCRCVAHEIVKAKKGAKTPETDAEVDEVCNDLEQLVIGGGPKVKETVSTLQKQRSKETLKCVKHVGIGMLSVCLSSVCLFVINVDKQN